MKTQLSVMLKRAGDDEFRHVGQIEVMSRPSIGQQCDHGGIQTIVREVHMPAPGMAPGRGKLFLEEE
jgi:hypothetical protein